MGTSQACGVKPPVDGKGYGKQGRGPACFLSQGAGQSQDAVVHPLLPPGLGRDADQVVSYVEIQTFPALSCPDLFRASTTSGRIAIAW